MAECIQPNPAAERVICTLSNLKNAICKYLGFWSVDSKIAETQDKVVHKL